MSTATSVAARQVYGVQRVCAAWGFPRATYYATTPRVLPPGGTAPAVPGKRGPKPVLDDSALPALIRADLAASPFIGEGHRKVFARLRYVGGHRVGRNRILRLMRQHQLLSPHRTAKRSGTQKRNGRSGTAEAERPEAERREAERREKRNGEAERREAERRSGTREAERVRF